MEWPSKDEAVWIYNQNTFSFEEEVKTMRAKMDAMTDVYDSLSQKMHDVDKTMQDFDDILKIRVLLRLMNNLKTCSPFFNDILKIDKKNFGL